MADTPESPLKFPCDFPLKVMGPTGFEFESKVITVVRKHVPDLGEGSVSTQHSKKGAYQAITIHIHATSKAQLDALYQELHKLPGVLMLL
jgi:putative lipoic acid-binding regulatory protein